MQTLSWFGGVGSPPSGSSRGMTPRREGRKESEKDFRSAVAFWKPETCGVEFASLLPSETVNDAQSLHLKVEPRAGVCKNEANPILMNQCGKLYDANSDLECRAEPVGGGGGVGKSFSASTHLQVVQFQTSLVFTKKA